MKEPKIYNIGYIGSNPPGATFPIEANDLKEAFEKTALILIGLGINPYPVKQINYFKGMN